MRAFVTVGSTQFDALVQAVLSPTILSTLREKSFHSLVVQCGKYAQDLGVASVEEKWVLREGGVDVEIWRFKPSLRQDYEKSDLIISHAGSGTILDVLRLGKPLIVIPNPTLADNHQEELAAALDKSGFLRTSTIAELSNNIQTFRPTSFESFPPMDTSKFRDLLDEEMGF